MANRPRSDSTGAREIHYPPAIIDDALGRAASAKSTKQFLAELAENSQGVNTEVKTVIIPEYGLGDVEVSCSDAELLYQVNRGQLWRNVKNGRIRSNGKEGNDLRLNDADVKAYVLSIRKNPRRESDENVQRLIDEHVPDPR
jgi:hypothetical protein